MKKWFALALVLTAFLWGEVTQEAVRADTVRLHVVANSDTWADQLEKLRVRDAVLAAAQEFLAEAKTKREAEAALQSRLPAIQKTAEGAARGRPIKVTMERQEFEAKTYDGFSLPAGAYTALRVEVGAGAGRNWFCVLYPALCLSGATDSYPTAAENAVVFGKYEIRSALLDWIAGKK